MGERSTENDENRSSYSRPVRRAWAKIVVARRTRVRPTLNIPWRFAFVLSFPFDRLSIIHPPTVWNSRLQGATEFIV